ncbi:hypothetical protein [Mesorhizobium sp. IMUNJ 23232]|uniref:hypothetical protein n=1 Tax=Mesorhizobium sp. IMUNJ 23232 TaxID=3376064 RepID=UPI00378EC718
MQIDLTEITSRLAFLFFGTLLLAGASITYRMSVPQIVDRYATPFDYDMEQRDYWMMWGRKQRAIREATSLWVAAAWISEAKNDREIMQNLNSTSERDTHDGTAFISHYLNVQWHLANHARAGARIACAIMILVGGAFTFIPIAGTVWEIITLLIKRAV